AGPVGGGYAGRTVFAGVEDDEDGLKARNGGVGEILVVIDDGEVFGAGFFDDVVIARQQPGDAGAIVGNRADFDAVPFGGFAPIGVVENQIGIAGGFEILIDIGAGADGRRAVVEIGLGGIGGGNAAIAFLIESD